jgi:outer membrane protein assembly factor BamB
VLTRSGNHASPFWAGSDIWRAGNLHRVASDGQSQWVSAALATTPPIIGASGIILVGGLPTAVAPQSNLNSPGVVTAYDQTGHVLWSRPTATLPQDLFVGDDGRVYVLTGGTSEGHLLAFEAATGAPRLDIAQVPAPWEMLLRNGVVYATGDSGMAAIPLPVGFATNYDPLAAWPVRQHDNQRTSKR